MRLVKTLWAGGFLDKAYLILGIVVLLSILWTSYKIVKDGSALRRLKFIEKATEDGCVALGKLCYFAIVESKKRGYVYDQYEIAYEVDGKMYYLAYALDRTMAPEQMKGRYPEDDLDTYTVKIMDMDLVYYDKKNPKKAYIKREALASQDILWKVNAPKDNIYRNITSNWERPIVKSI